MSCNFLFLFSRHNMPRAAARAAARAHSFAAHHRRHSSSSCRRSSSSSRASTSSSVPTRTQACVLLLGPRDDDLAACALKLADVAAALGKLNAGALPAAAPPKLNVDEAAVVVDPKRGLASSFFFSSSFSFFSSSFPSSFFSVDLNPVAHEVRPPRLTIYSVRVELYLILAIHDSYHEGTSSFAHTMRSRYLKNIAPGVESISVST